MSKIPLDQRLSDANINTKNTNDFMLRLAGIHLEEFFQALDRLPGDTYFQKVYYNCILLPRT